MSRCEQLLAKLTPPEVVSFLAVGGIGYVVDVTSFNLLRSDSFLRAAELLGVKPAAATVFEDALAGVEAGRRGNFGCVVGVDRVGQKEALRRNGADIVVTDLAELLAKR